MKTKNNVQKTILRVVAVVVSFVLISFTVSAQDFWKKLLTNSSFNEIAIAMVETSKESNVPTNSGAEKSRLFIFDEIYEPPLEMEAWMTGESNFGNSKFQTTVEVENQLELEDWMHNDDFFRIDNEVEQSLELEGWMTSDQYWNS